MIHLSPVSAHPCTARTTSRLTAPAPRESACGGGLGYHYRSLARKATDALRLLRQFHRIKRPRPLIAFSVRESNGHSQVRRASVVDYQNIQPVLVSVMTEFPSSSRNSICSEAGLRSASTTFRFGPDLLTTLGLAAGSGANCAESSSISNTASAPKFFMSTLNPGTPVPIEQNQRCLGLRGAEPLVRALAPVPGCNHHRHNRRSA